MNTLKKLHEIQRHARRSQGLREAIAHQEIEGNPLTEDEIRMFEDFEARGLTHEQRREEIARILFEKYGVRQQR